MLNKTLYFKKGHFIFAWNQAGSCDQLLGIRRLSGLELWHSDSPRQEIWAEELGAASCIVSDSFSCRVLCRMLPNRLSLDAEFPSSPFFVFEM